MTTALIAALGIVFAAAVTGFVTWLTMRGSNKVQTEATELDGWRSLAGEYQAERDRVRTRLEHLEGKSQAQDEALRTERLKREGFARELDREQQRTTSLERRFKAAVTYIESLLTLLRAHDIEPPPRPDAMSD